MAIAEWVTQRSHNPGSNPRLILWTFINLLWPLLFLARRRQPLVMRLIGRKNLNSHFFNWKVKPLFTSLSNCKVTCNSCKLNYCKFILQIVLCLGYLSFLHQSEYWCQHIVQIILTNTNQKNVIIVLMIIDILFNFKLCWVSL